MPEQFTVSPLLDGFTVGTPVNDHYGVCCYPAVKANSERKYIVKVISIPASQTQLDALLITGAYSSSAEAAEYFRQLTDNLVSEAQLLRTLSRLNGFLPFEGCQVEPMPRNRVGFEVYLLSGFRLSLERYMHRHTVSHLEAVNLGIDLCAALTACRAEGMLYIDLKPSNIYISNKKEYKIGDLGFIPLDSMRYTPMPERYRSCYTAPELLDDLCVLNGTADTYALGMILYQLFNGGVLPQEHTGPLPPPSAADQEMAAILLKACAPDPADRWEDPSQMGQALIDYMQRGTINDVPIMEPISGAVSGQNGEAVYQTAKFPVPETETPPEPEVPVESADTQPETDAPQPEPEAAPPEPVPEPAELIPEESLPEASQDFVSFPSMEAEEAPVLQAAEPETPMLQASEAESELSAAEIEAAAAEEFSRLTGEFSPPVQEDIPETIGPEQLDQELAQMNQLLRASEKPIPRTTKPQPHVEPVVIKPPKKKKSAVGILFLILLLCLLLAGSVWGYMYYRTEYLQHVNAITIQEDLGSVVVSVDSGIREGLLSVVLTDPYGNSYSRNVLGGKAEFTELTPGTFYNVQVQISGLHKLTGSFSTIHTTEGITNVTALTASVGPQDGSVELNLIVEGHEPDQWKVFYSAEGVPKLGQVFNGHSVTLENLEIGKLYTFEIELSNGGKLSPAGGQNTVQFTPVQIIGVRDLSIVSCVNGQLTVQWNSTVDIQPEYWRVRCYGGTYDETQEVQGTQAVFSGISASQPYTVEVCAKGMTQLSRVSVSANPITLTDFSVDTSDPLELKLSWQYQGTAPEDGWMVTYTLDNSDLPNVVKANGTTAVIAPRIPGATYRFTCQADGNVTVFGGTQVFRCPDAQSYHGHSLRGENISARLLVTPVDEDWSYYSLPGDCYTDIFQAGQPISVLLRSNIGFYLDDEDIQILYVYRDASGGAAPELIGEDTKGWRDLWIRDDTHYAELNIPVSPTKPGSYVLDIYFNGMAAASANLTVQ